PAGWTPPPSTNAAITTRQVHVNMAWKTPQFWLLWGVLCLNVSAGIGVLGMASPMLQEVFGGRLLGGTGTLAELSDADRTAVATIAAGFLGLLSLANILGRIGWASFSDKLGRKMTYYAFFALGFVLYAAAPFAGRIGSAALFVAIFCVILTMYGGGFATIPAYLADLFGTQFVGAIHGRLLTAWSTAGILGPTLVNALRESQLARGVPAAQAYNVTMYILAGLLLAGLTCNALVRPVAERFYMTDEELARVRAAAGAGVPAAAAVGGMPVSRRTGLGVIGAWVAVGIPLAWGMSVTVQKALQLFR
ncbi:MAG: MFS transporter, partial [Gemmatimonadota bacterium]